MKISVFGLGYVGTVVAGCLSKAGHEVIGVDIERHKVDFINRGHAPIIERQIDEIIATQVKARRLSATTDVAAGVQLADVILIAVGTPGLPNGELELTYLRRVSKEIGNALKDHPGTPVIAVRSTTLPGTTREVVVPLLERTSEKRAGIDFKVCSNPEFLREGSAVDDFYNPAKTVIGELGEGHGDRLIDLYADLPGPVAKMTLEAAEMIKYTDNAWHALKIGFANEIGNICKAFTIDGHEVMDVFCKDRKLNISPAYLKPGFAFGGYCLPKDLRALLSKTKKIDVDVPILSAILPSNELQIERGLRAVLAAGKRKVGVLGISFKAGTDDLRESPAIDLTERLIGKGYDVRVYDHNVNLARLNGTNRSYVLDRIPHICNLMAPNVDAVIDHADTLVVGNAAPEFENIPRRVRDDQLVVDLVRISKERSVDGVYEGICW